MHCDGKCMIGIKEEEPVLLAIFFLILSFKAIKVNICSC